MEFLEKLSNFSSFFDSLNEERRRKDFPKKERERDGRSEEKLFESIYVVFMLKFTRSAFSPLVCLVINFTS